MEDAEETDGCEEAEETPEVPKQSKEKYILWLGWKLPTCVFHSLNKGFWKIPR